MALTLCAYCGERKVRAEGKPRRLRVGGEDEEVEHPIPAAAGSLKFEMTASCDDCQAFTSTDVDAPFLQDPYTLMMRGEHDIRDPRHNTGRPKSPLRRGISEHGAEFVMREDGTPHMVRAGWAVDADANLSIAADTTKAYERVVKDIVAFFESYGHEAPELGAPWTIDEAPKIKGRFWYGVGRWRRAAAKVALGAGALAYEEDWRASPSARALQRLMRGEEVEGVQVEPTIDSALAVMAASRPPRHRVFFHPLPDGATGITVMFFGTNPFTLVADTEGRPFPAMAWDIDPHRPNASGATTWAEILESSLEAIAADERGDDLGEPAGEAD